MRVKVSKADEEWIHISPIYPQYAVAPGDRRFLMIRPLATGTQDELIVVENWFDELKAKSR